MKGSTQEVFSLQFYASPEELSSFLVLELNESSSCPEKLDLFTPIFMQWRERLWIFDLKSCRSYWQSQAQEQGLYLHEVLLRILEENFVSFRAVLSPHPWPALLLLRLMRSRELPGLLVWETPYTQSLYKSISWAHWFEEARLLNQKKCSLQSAKADQPIGMSQHVVKGQRNLRAFAQSIQKLYVRSPWDFQDMPSAQLQRRFGELVAQCWSWTYPCAPSAKGPVQLSLFDHRQTTYPYDLKAFPWASYSSREAPEVHRLLEFPMTGWETLEPLLREDLDKLCKHPQLSSRDQVCELQWLILLPHFKELKVPIVFHSPHSLHKEMEEHKTTLNQFYYAYEKAMKEFKTREEDLDLPLQIPFIAWEIEVSQKMSLAPQSQDLFVQERGSLFKSGSLSRAFSLSSAQISQIRELANKLPAPLICYSLYPDFCPEKSYRTSSSPTALPDFFEEEMELLESWKLAAQRRPLFIFKKAKRLASATLNGPRYFLERSSEAWWEMGTSELYFRDYFLMQAQDQKWLWTYRTPEGRWFQHGLYS